jgi:hypothetical protein
VTEVKQETRFHTDKDREYATDLLDDLGIVPTPTQLADVSQWLCKVRVETARRASDEAYLLGHERGTVEGRGRSESWEAVNKFDYERVMAENKLGAAEVRRDEWKARALAAEKEIATLRGRS